MPTRATHCHDPEFGHRFLLDKPARSMRGLTRLIGHRDPEVRALAAVDPALLEPPLEDPDDAVRRAAATNPTPTPETLETLLMDLRTAEGAATNPSLPSLARTRSSTTA